MAAAAGAASSRAAAAAPAGAADEAGDEGGASIWGAASLAALVAGQPPPPPRGDEAEAEDGGAAAAAAAAAAALEAALRPHQRRRSIGGAEEAEARRCLLALPAHVLAACIVPRLDAASRRALRGACAAARLLANACVTRVRITPTALAAPPAARLGDAFPLATHLACADDGIGAALTDGGLMAALDGPSLGFLRRLRSADLMRCGRVSSALVHFLGRHCPGLTSLAPPRWMTASAGLQHLSLMPKLSSLALGDEQLDVLNIDDACLGGLLPLGGRLRRLSLARCRRVVSPPAAGAAAAAEGGSGGHRAGVRTLTPPNRRRRLHKHSPPQVDHRRGRRVAGPDAVADVP